MKSISEKPSVLSVHEGEPGQYILRVGDLKYRPLVVGITKLLADARSFVVVTPSDIKYFQVNENGAGQVSEEAEVEAPESEIPVDPETQAEIDREVGDTDSGQPTGENVRRRRGRPAKTPNSVCGRCRGSGRILTLVEGGQKAESACPVCSGSGQIIRYGAR